MPRKARIEQAGYYHVINRGVEKRKIFLHQNDFEKFLDIIKGYKTLYSFSIKAYCLMSNHYHLLLRTRQENLSIIMRQVNYNYTIYFNKKYKRVGPLWQSRFESWYVFDQRYLETLIKYIEHNPIKANITQHIGEYLWASSHSKDGELSEQELQDIEILHQTKLQTKKGEIKQLKEKKLSEIFRFSNIDQRNKLVLEAVYYGHKQTEIAKHLNLSDVAISKILKQERTKEQFFIKLKDIGVFWSYDPALNYTNCPTNIIIEYSLKYADYNDLITVFKLYRKKQLFEVWSKYLKSDLRFIKTNLLIARIFFGMVIETDYFKRLKNDRTEKLKLLAS